MTRGALECLVPTTKLLERTYRAGEEGRLPAAIADPACELERAVDGLHLLPPPIVVPAAGREVVVRPKRRGVQVVLERGRKGSFEDDARLAEAVLPDEQNRLA